MFYLTGNSENVIYTSVSSVKELSSPTYLMSLTHSQTGRKWSFIPQNITPQSGTPYNQRYDLFQFNISGGTENLTGGTRVWLHQKPNNFVYDDIRYKGTGKSYFSMETQIPVVATYHIFFDWTIDGDVIDFSSFTASINGQLFTGLTQNLGSLRGGGTDFVQISVTPSDITLSDIYTISYSASSNSGETMSGEVYIPSPDLVNQMKPWQYYDGNNASADYYKTYPATAINTPSVNIDEIGEFRYSIYEQVNPVNLNTSVTYNQLEVGLAYITEGFTDIFYDNNDTSDVYNP